MPVIIVDSGTPFCGIKLDLGLRCQIREYKPTC
jgi:hypothetical protein